MGCRDHAAPVALDTETTDLNPFRAELVGIGICWGEDLDALAYIPIGHKPSDDTSPVQLPLEQVPGCPGPLAGQRRPSQNPAERQIRPADPAAPRGEPGGVVIDTLLADYLGDAAAKHGLELMAEQEFGFQPTASAIWWARSRPLPTCRWRPPACTAAWMFMSPAVWPCCCAADWRRWAPAAATARTS